ncbi:hypothetical protein [Anaerolentibacter hominis]|uniref:class I mannose-6-phosphate isomerase n=1 Tax=Anaerolentibacter hominis TaxID=3079009 RepID=UPI0031B8813C
MNIYKMPWRLVQNKFIRYPGGREIDRFRGIYPGADDGRPEAWIGSDTRVNNVTPENPNEGCQECILPDGRQMFLFEAIELDPEAMLGAEHLKLSGAKMGILAKLLDAEKQLKLQCHPDRPYAKKWFNSDYGKAESWYIIDKRTDCDEPPYVLLGFKEGVTRKDYEEGFYNDDIKAMEACCHKIPVEIGDCFNVEAGAPHAIGAGCFLVEVQEPSDITVGAVRKTDGTKEEQEFFNERLLGCYHYEGSSYEDNLKRFKIEPKILREGDWGKEEVLIGTKQTPYFSFTRLDATKPVPVLKTGFLQLGICLSGKCKLVYEGGEMEIKKADEFFFPAGIEEITVVPEEEGVSMILCHPAGVEL